LHLGRKRSPVEKGDRYVEMASHGCSDDLRQVWVYALRSDENGVHSGALSRANQRSKISWIANSVGDKEEWGTIVGRANIDGWKRSDSEDSLRALGVSGTVKGIGIHALHQYATFGERRREFRRVVVRRH